MARGRKNITETEIGNTGLNLKGVSGKVEEDLSKLWKGKKKKEFISEMKANDPYVNAWINAKNAIALKPDWGIKPKEGTEEKNTQKAQEYAELIEGMLFEDMSTTFNSFVLNSVTMAEYGFALSEIVLKKRNGKTDNAMTSSLYDDGLFGIAKLAPRWQNSITKWDIDNNGNIENVYQKGDFANDIKIPYKKVLHFVMNGYNGNPEGESVLRGTFSSYYNKKNIERIQRETFERGFSGILDIQVPPRYLSKKILSNEALEVRKNLEAFMKNVKQGKEAGIIRPFSKDFVIELIQGKTGTGLDPDKMIDRYNTEIVLCLLSDSFMGKSKVYQGASGEQTKTKLYKSFIGIILDEIKEQVNKKLIPMLFEVNNLDAELMPYLDYGNLDDLDLQAVSWFIQSVAKTAGPLITPTYELNNYLLDKLVGKMAPKPTEEQWENAQMRYEIQTINNINYEALQNPEYLDADGNPSNDKNTLTVSSANDLNDENSTRQNSDKVDKKPRGNYGGAMKGGT
jgi:hypothetical protein